MKYTALAFLLLCAGCATRPQPENPYIPPSTQYSAASTVTAGVGLIAAAAGAGFAQDPAASKTVRAAGTAAMGTGVGLMAVSLIDAIEVRKEREKFMNLARAFYHQYFGPPPIS